MHSQAHGLAIGPLKIPRGIARTGQAVLRHNDSPALLQLTHQRRLCKASHGHMPAIQKLLPEPHQVCLRV